MFENAHSMVSLPKTWKVSSVTCQSNLCKGTLLENQELIPCDFTKQSGNMFECYLKRLCIPIELRRIVNSYLYVTLDQNNVEAAGRLWEDDIEQCMMKYGFCRPLDQNSFKHAFNLWIQDMHKCALTYGHISTWNIDGIRALLSEIHNRRDFNDYNDDDESYDDFNLFDEND
jgi:hypothetical protein